MTAEQELLLVCGILLLIGIMMFSAGMYTLHYFTIGKKKKCTVETVGTVVDQVIDREFRKYPVVEYEANGKVYRKRNSASITKQIGTISGDNGYARGQKLTVHYDPDKPTRWMINNSKEQLVIPIVFLSFGFVFLVIAGIIYINM